VAIIIIDKSLKFKFSMIQTSIGYSNLGKMRVYHKGRNYCAIDTEEKNAKFKEYKFGQLFKFFCSAFSRKS